MECFERLLCLFSCGLYPHCCRPKLKFNELRLKYQLQLQIQCTLFFVQLTLASMLIVSRSVEDFCSSTFRCFSIQRRPE